MCSVERRGRVYVLTLTGEGEHRMNPALAEEMLAALARIRSSAGGGPAALVTAAEGRFFSNGLDLEWARRAGGADLMGRAYARVLAAVVSMPMPTVAAVTGHAAAGGFFLVLAHDAVAMRADRGWLYMSELDIGLPVADAVMGLARAKMGARGRRTALLGAAKMGAAAAAEMGIVDGVFGGAAETVAGAVRVGEEMAALGWDGPAFAAARLRLFPDLAKIVEAAGENWGESKL